MDVYVEAWDGETSGLADYIPGVGINVVSARLKQVWEDSGAKVEFIPMPVQYRGQLLDGYFLARPVCVHGVDRGASDAQFYSVGIASTINKLVLNDAAFANAPVALVHELAEIAVKDDLARKILSAGCVGCAFVEAGAYRR